ncbi:hypothetical protein SCACP_28010 [Sporomusa carbonis]|uniref:hypothetical protein n=1 Tax=Sporomusa carbonis TaxID=3076075 RepID=UPI003A709E2B
MYKKIVSFSVLLVTVAMLLWVPQPAFAKPFFHGSGLRDVVKLEDVIIPQGDMVDNVVVMGGNVTIAGAVKDEVVVINGDLTLQQTAQLNERAFVIGGQIIREEGAVVRKGFVNVGPGFANLTSILLAGAIVLLLGFVTLAVAAVLVVIPPILAWYFPKKNSQLQTICERYFLKNMKLGILSSIAFFIIEALLVISIIGLPLALLLGALFLAAAILGVSGLCTSIGTRIAARIGSADKPILIQTLYGSVAVALIANIPFVGLLALLFVVLFGIGAVAIDMFGKK